MKVMKVYGLILLLCVWLSAADSSAGEGDLAEAMAENLECYPVELLSFKKQKPSIVRENAYLAAIYHESGAEPLWFQNRRDWRSFSSMKRAVNGI